MRCFLELFKGDIRPPAPPAVGEPTRNARETGQATTVFILTKKFFLSFVQLLRCFCHFLHQPVLHAITPRVNSERLLIVLCEHLVPYPTRPWYPELGMELVTHYTIQYTSAFLQSTIIPYAHYIYITHRPYYSLP